MNWLDPIGFFDYLATTLRSWVVQPNPFSPNKYPAISPEAAEAENLPTMGNSPSAQLDYSYYRLGGSVSAINVKITNKQQQLYKFQLTHHDYNPYKLLDTEMKKAKKELTVDDFEYIKVHKGTSQIKNGMRVYEFQNMLNSEIATKLNVRYLPFSITKIGMSCLFLSYIGCLAYTRGNLNTNLFSYLPNIFKRSA